MPLPPPAAREPLHKRRIECRGYRRDDGLYDLVIDLDVVENNYRRMRELLPAAHIFYAVKANPAPQILSRLTNLGSKFDAEGNIWVVLCLTGSFSSEVPFRGWAVRVTPDGRTIPTTSGIRSPGGIGFGCDGSVLYTDNQGPWNGSCALKELRPGEFVGHPGGFKWYDLAPGMGPRPEEPKSGSRWAAEAERDLAVGDRHPHPDFHALGRDPLDVGHHPRPLVQLDDRGDVGQPLLEGR